MTSTAAPARIARLTYERTDCHRCAGTGAHGPMSVHGGRCFNCEGSGLALTRAGKTARARVEQYVQAHMIVAASSLNVGDRIVDQGKTRTVTERTTTLGQGNGKSFTGVRDTESFVESWTYGQTIVRTKSGWSLAGAAHYPIRRAWTQADLQDVAAQLGHLKGLTVVTAAEG